MSAVCSMCGKRLESVMVVIEGMDMMLLKPCECMAPKPDQSCGNCRWQDKPDGFAKCERCVVERNWEAK